MLNLNQLRTLNIRRIKKTKSFGISVSCSRVLWKCSKGVLAPLLHTFQPGDSHLYVMTFKVHPFFFLYLCVCSVELGHRDKRTPPDGCGGVQVPCVSQLSSQSLLLPVRRVLCMVLSCPPCFCSAPQTSADFLLLRLRCWLQLCDDGVDARVD